MPAVGPFRFRVRRTNDNRDYKGRDASLIDDVVLKALTAITKPKNQFISMTQLSDLRRMAIGSGTNASELNMMALANLILSMVSAN